MTKKPWYMENYKNKFSARSNQRILPHVEAALAIEQAGRDAHRDTDHFHASEMAKDNWCPRSTWYKMTGTEVSDNSRLDLRRMNILAEGNNIHDKWQRWMAKTGKLYGTWKCLDCGNSWDALSPEECPACGEHSFKYAEVSIFHPELRILGHADGIWEDDLGRAVIEIKSVGLGTIRWEAPELYAGYESGDLTLDELWARIKRPLSSHRKQVNIYMMCLGIDSAIMIYEWKPSQEIKEFHVKYDPALAQPIILGIKQVEEQLGQDIPPARPDTAKFKSCNFCRFCSFKTTCWS